jgi:glycosyltransferase involved in cell wall biosynthesis
MSTISILVPVYAKPQHVLYMLQSLENQFSYPHEVVLVDDNHSVETSNLIANFCKQTKLPTRLIKNDRNLGISASTKTAIESIDTDFIGFLDSDDYLLPNAITRFNKLQKRFPRLDIYSSNFAYFENALYEAKPEDTKPRDRQEILDAHGIWSKALLFENVLTHFRVIRREKINLDLLDSKFDGIQDAIINFSLHPSSTAVIDEQVTYLHRLHMNQFTTVGKSIAEKYRHLNTARLSFRNLLIQKEQGAANLPLIESTIASAPNLKHHLTDVCAGSFVSIDALFANQSQPTVNDKLASRTGVHVIKRPEAEQLYKWQHSLVRLMESSQGPIGFFLESRNSQDWDFALNYSGVFDFILVDSKYLTPILRNGIPSDIPIVTL